MMGLFGGGKSSGLDAASPYLDQIPGASHDNFDPYINRGNEAGDDLTKQYGDMSQDPTAFINALMEGYKPSEGYQYKQNAMDRSAGNTAAAGGMRGTPQDILQHEQLTQGLLGDDMQQWIENLMGIKKTGLQGEQGLYDKGFDATKELNSDETNVLGQKGGLAYQDQQNKEKKKNDWMKAIASGIGTVGGMAVGAPAGPAGATAGGTVGGNFLSKFF